MIITSVSPSKGKLFEVTLDDGQKLWLHADLLAEGLEHLLESEKKERDAAKQEKETAAEQMARLIAVIEQSKAINVLKLSMDMLPNS